MPSGKARSSKAARASCGFLQVENMLHTQSAQHSKPDISSQLIICIKIPLLAGLPLEARW